jgi:hypothetical protein
MAIPQNDVEKSFEKFFCRMQNVAGIIPKMTATYTTTRPEVILL